MTEEDTIRNVMFDSRLDQTKVRRFDEQTGRYYARTETQHHYTVTDGDGRFLVHITKPIKEKEVQEDELGIVEEDIQYEENNVLETDEEIEETDEEKDMRQA